MAEEHIGELACTYAALALHDDGVEITADKINTMVRAAGVSIEPFWPSLFAKLLQGKDVGEILSNVGSAPAAAPAAAGGAAAGGAAEAKEEVKEEEPAEESEEDMGFSLFD